MTRDTTSISPTNGALPYQYELVDSSNGKLASQFEIFMTRVNENANQLMAVPSSALTLNPDFNFTRTKGTTPTTQADGDDAEFVEQWNVVGATGGNTYTITPTAYTLPAENLTGSKFFVNVNISAMPNAPIYFYNVNYSSDFDTAILYQRRQIALSMQINNNLSTQPLVRFRAVTDISNQTTTGRALYIKPGLTNVGDTLDLPELDAASGDFTQLQLVIEDLGGPSADIDLKYIKAEIGSNSYNLGVNHTLEKLKIDNL